MNVLSAPALPHGLPPLSQELKKHVGQVNDYLLDRIEDEGGFLPFDQWMHHALYAPHLGYYTGGSTKFGSNQPTGDFTTAPELSPLFAQTLSRQVMEVLEGSQSLSILEFGAGSGALAEALITELRKQGIEPQYSILEVSPDLRARQQERLAPLEAQVQWLDSAPHSFKGCVVANEVLDAMPASLFTFDVEGKVLEVGVIAADDSTAQGLPAPFYLATRPAPEHLATLVAERVQAQPFYLSEINLQAEAWVRSMGTWLKQGAAILIDYGFPQREYYHPQRDKGTLMCHFRHFAHAEPLVLAGLQDITAHVDFTAMADAALEAGLDVLGYTSQARFLMNCGITNFLASPPEDPSPAVQQQWAQTMSAANKLLSEAEMGELFKVLIIGRDISAPVLGTMSGDRRERL